MTKIDDEQMVSQGGILPVADLKGRAVWDEAGHRIGTLRRVDTDADGNIVALDVQRRWMLGPHDVIGADGMRLDGDDIIVPQLAVPADSPARGANVARTDRDVVAPAAPDNRVNRGVSTSPTFVAGREGARARYGGVSLVSGLMGALVAIATAVLLGTVLTLAFDRGTMVFDVTNNTTDTLTTSTLWIGIITLGVACLLGGINAGRSARFDGVRNGLLVPVWGAVLMGAFAIAGAIFGDKYNVFTDATLPNLPAFEFNDLGDWSGVGIVTMLIAFGVMLVAGAIGGLLGELWMRRADRAMFDVVPVGGSTTGMGDRSVASDDTAVTTVPVVATGMQSNPAAAHRAPALTSYDDHNPTTVREDSSFVGGTGVMPQPRAPRENDPTR